MKKFSCLFALLISSAYAELLCKDCSEVVHSVDDFSENAMTLWLIKNEIFAVNGQQFDDPNLQHYFEKQEWYKPLPESITLTDIQKKNIVVIEQKLQRLRVIRPVIVQELNQLKYMPKPEILAQWEKEFPEATMVHFFKLLEYLDLTVFGYSDNYIITIENDKLVQKYTAMINGDNVIFSYHEQTSNLDKISEYDEWYIQWNFKLENDKLVFKTIDIAG